MNNESLIILMGILVLLIGCSCLGKPNVILFREGMSAGEYTKRKSQQAQSNDYSGPGSIAINQGNSLGSYNDQDYMNQDALTASHRPFTETKKEKKLNDKAVQNQISYERQQMYQANKRMQNARQGIPRNQIPNGDENLYILKSEIVPPVCPACPTVTNCPSQKKCQPCPPCGRCPEPAFECKKVPNYKSISPSYLPKPILSDFSEFGL